MPFSSFTGRPEMAQWAKENNFKTVLDIGAGSGEYADEFARISYFPERIDAVEAFEPYIPMFDLTEKYDNIFVGDVFDFEDFNYDLIILGDIIEHMRREDAINLWEKISKQARYAFIKMPIGLCTQENIFQHPVTKELMQNEYERHLEPESTMEEILSSFSHIFKFEYFVEDPYNDPDGNPIDMTFGTGVFYAKFGD